jgi:hypothetical protein
MEGGRHRSTHGPRREIGGNEKEGEGGGAGGWVERGGREGGREGGRGEEKAVRQDKRRK